MGTEGILSAKCFGIEEKMCHKDVRWLLKITVDLWSVCGKIEYGTVLRLQREIVMLDLLLNLDGNILLFLQEHIRNPFMTPILRLITTLGNGGAVWIAFTVLLLCIPKTRKIGCMALAALLGTLLVNNMILKNLVARTRPYEVIEGLTYIVMRPTDFSFPSGHAGCSFAVGCILFRRLPRQYGIPALILAILIAVSRLYVGVHYPSDVLFGVISGTFISYGAERIVDWLWRRHYIEQEEE